MGFPQKRERIIIFGTMLDKQFLFPGFFNADSFGRITAYKKMLGKPSMTLLIRVKKSPNHIALNHSDIVVRRYELIPEGGKLPKPEFLPEDIRRKNFGNTYTRLSRNEVSSTIVPGNNALPVHPTLNRSLTPREAARIQTFPDDYIFMGDRRSLVYPSRKCSASADGRYNWPIVLICISMGLNTTEFSQTSLSMLILIMTFPGFKVKPREQL